jgi:hypothetical protein
MLLVSGGDEKITFQCMLALLLNPDHMYYYVFWTHMPLLQFMIFLTESLIKTHHSKLVPHLKGI